MNQSIQKALNYIGREQQADGSFASFSSPSITPFLPDKRYNSVFAPALILSTLTEIEASGPIRDKLAGWLIKQKSPHWSYNYWSKDSAESKQLPYPDDLDDTACALIGLGRHDPALIDGKALAGVVKLLIATESKPGGPYRTWLVPKNSQPAWQDIDPAVNANVAALLLPVSNPLPGLTQYLESVIDSAQYKSPYYPNQFPIFYYLSRGYRGPKQDKLIKHILRFKHGHSWGTPLHTALAVSSLCRLGHTLDAAEITNYLAKTQLQDGSWPAEAYCIDPAIKGQTFYGGSQTLTTALIAEALALVESQPQTNKAEPKIAKNNKADSIHAIILQESSQRLNGLGLDARRPAKELIEHLAGNSRDITLLAYSFYTGLKKPPRLSNDFFAELGLANLFGWTAYTIYDDFLDDEGDPKKLSAANASLRFSLLAFQNALPHHQGFQNLVQKTFNAIDSANAWEVNRCRFAPDRTLLPDASNLPDFGKLGKLADRSLGHTLTPVAILAKAGYPPDSIDTKATVKALRHYIIARQINDDLHDWQQDFARGHITFVVKEILADLSLKQTDLPQSLLLTQMQRQFWSFTLPRLTEVVAKQTRTARQALKSVDSLKPSNVITELLDHIDSINQHTLKTVGQAADFLDNYRSKPRQSATIVTVKSRV